jgi:YVTN family beta-propeller protein
VQIPFPSFRWRTIAVAAFCASALFAQTAGPSFGDIVSVGATPSDMVLDEARKRVYLVNSAANRVEIYDYLTKSIAGTVGVGTTPISAAMSMDGALLYVTNRDSSTLSVIDIDRQGIRETVSLPARPEGVEVGVDGRVVITTQGTGQNNALNTLLLYDRNQSFGQQILSLPTPQPISTPTPLNQLFIGRPPVAFPGRMIRTPDGRFVIGMVAINQTTTTAQTTLFVYESASGVVLNSRTVTGQSSVLSVSPDGSKFMAGSTLYDTATLAVLAQMNTANLPFFIQVLNNGTFGANPNFNIQNNYGGSAFSPDSQTVYSAFNTSATGLRPLANVLYISNPTHLGVRLGIRMPQSILGKMVATSDGERVFAASESGIIDLPIATLYENPILQPETTQVFMAIDDCNKGIARAQVKVANLGSGRVTYNVPNVTAALVSQVTTGVAPSTVTFTMEPGRSGVVRQPGTNLFTNAGSGGGAPISVILTSNEAINLPNVVRVYMNYRQSDQRGIIHPLPTSLNTAQGLQELLLDEPRGRVYITNAGYNRLEIFDIQRNRFLPPVEVGQLPRSMAMSLDRSLLYVGNTGGESITTVDLDALIVTGNVDFPPIPRSGSQAAIQPFALAMGLSGLQFMMSNGSFWRVVGNQATPRLANNVTPATITSPQYMIATPGGEKILTLAGNGTGYLYDALADTYTTSRQLYDQTPQSYFGPLGASERGGYYVVSGMILNSALGLIGGSERPGATQFVPPTQPGQPPTQVIVSAGQRNVAMAYAIDETRFARLTTPVRQNTTAQTRDDVRPTFELVDTRSGAETVVGVAPENPVQSVFGATRVNVPSKQMAIDSAGTAYAITLSGLSVVQLSIAGTPARPSVPGASAIVNSNDGTTNYRPGSFITINGANLAGSATADTLPLPTLLGGTCVTFNDIAIPLMQTSDGQISGVIPPEVRAGQNVVQVRSLATAQSSNPLVVTVQRPLD